MQILSEILYQNNKDNCFCLERYRSNVDLLISLPEYIIGHNYHGHYLHAGGLSVNNYVRENKVREVNVRE